MNTAFTDALKLAPAVQKVLAAAQQGAAAYEVSPGLTAPLVCALAGETDRTLLLVCPSDREARRLQENINQLFPDSACVMPSRERQFAMIEASRETQWQRIAALDAISRGERRVLCLAADTLLERFAPADVYGEACLALRVGQVLDPEELSLRLSRMGYERVPMVEGRGQYALRGSIADIYPVNREDPLRVEFFDREIDGIRSFNSISQRSIQVHRDAYVPPASETLLSDKDWQTAAERFAHALEGEGDAFFRGSAAAVRIRESLAACTLPPMADMMRNVLMPSTVCLLQRLSNPLVVVDTPEQCRSRLDDAYLGYHTDWTMAVEQGTGFAAQQELLITPEEVLGAVNAHSVITLQQFLRGGFGFRQGVPVRFGTVNPRQYAGNLRELTKDLTRWRSDGTRVFLLCGSEARTDRILSGLKTEGWLPGAESVLPCALSHGFVWEEQKLAVLSDTDILGDTYRKTRARSRSGEKLAAFTDLTEGDYVVHEMYGIGVYKGVTRLESDGVSRDYLLIEYTGNDKLYVPTDQFDRVQKYIGSQGEVPALSDLNGREWKKQKARVKSGLKELAFNLVQLYAQRESTPGYAFSPDSAWTMEFNDAFPYELTEDQQSAVEEIKRDMESTRNMDRLLCGDVGYGKTEVALRAAFKAVNDGKQVAFLAPTTILAQQHYYTCLSRFKGFPVQVEVLSRFRSAKEQRQTVAHVASGETDILVGTHRMLSEDVRFKNLGLLIVDEEQRFGVSHKEKIKNLKKTVDVLTLSATPIPRTLHMSMIGIRDMSVLETPPEERLPVQTYVIDFNEAIVRDAITREVDRGGQVYFLFNRVAEIEQFAARLRALVPDVRIGVAHGQMRENALETVMLDFYEGRYDLLLCSTIIESGLDVRRANTLIVYDADRFGLSQLYQLRGRVGRSDRQAYAYFTVKRDKMLTEVAEKRLGAIREFTAFGSGFRIALRDLEIRGAGDVFGAEQSGRIASVGYDLYCKMIEEAVQEARGENTEKQALEPRVGLRVDAYLPEEYVRGSAQRVEVYKRIAMIRSLEDRADMIDELIDRFGEIPDSVMMLLDVAYLRALAIRLGVSVVQRVQTGVLLRFDTRFLPDMKQLILAMETMPEIRFASAKVPGLIVTLPEKTTSEDAVKIVNGKLTALLRSSGAAALQEKREE